MRSFVANGQGARLDSTVNASELLINTVIKAGRKQRSTPEPKGKWPVVSLLDWDTSTKRHRWKGRT